MEPTRTQSTTLSRPSALFHAQQSGGHRNYRPQRLGILMHLFEGAVVSERHLGEAEFLIGRDTRAGITLVSARASRHHARLFNRRGAWILEDTGSRHGILLHGIRVHSVSLREGDLLQLGDDVLSYSLA